jgi:hypothetical protein
MALAGIVGNARGRRRLRKLRCRTPRLNERSGNVYENKGTLWRRRDRSGNVFENKYTYPLNPGMFLKRKDVKT